MPHSFLKASQFTTLAGIEDRRGRRALARAHDGHTWRGHRLVVRVVHGRGGKSGRQYEVLVSSLPDKLQEAWRAQAQATLGDTAPTVEIDENYKITKARLEVVKSALSLPSGTPERAREIDRLAKLEWDWPDGKRRQFSARTLRTWIAGVERSSLSGLKKKPRADKGMKRYLISRKWDRAVALDAETKAGIERDLRRHIISLWQGRTGFAGVRRIAQLASYKLMELTRDAGCDLDQEKLRTVCHVTKEYANEERRHKKVAIHDHDQKRAFDNLPRISRDTGALKPMECIMGDVHPMDILHQRQDGSTATAKLIAWLDVATNRVFPYLAFLEKGKGVTREHVTSPSSPWPSTKRGACREGFIWTTVRNMAGRAWLMTPCNFPYRCFRETRTVGANPR